MAVNSVDGAHRMVPEILTSQVLSHLNLPYSDLEFHANMRQSNVCFENIWFVTAVLKQTNYF